MPTASAKSNSRLFALAVLISASLACGDAVPAQPIQATTSRPAAVLVWAWYSSGKEYARGQLHSLDLGLYDSRDPAVHQDHIAKWKAAGINLVLLSWWGLPHGKGFKQHVHDAVQGYASALSDAQMSWAIFWEDTRPEDLEATLEQFSTWAAQPYYAHQGGKPLLFVYNRLYDTYPLTDPLWGSLLESYHVVFDKVVERAIPELPKGAGYMYWDVPFTAESDVRRKYDLAKNNGEITRWFFVNHGFDNRGLFQPDETTCPGPNAGGQVWPDGGSSPDWLRHQFNLALEYAPIGIIFPWNELGEHSAFEPTDPLFGNACGGRGYGTTYYDLMKGLVEEFQAFGRQSQADR